VAANETQIFLDHLQPSALTADVLDIDVGVGAVAVRLLLQTGEGMPVALTRVRLAKDATFRQFILSEGGRLARLETEVELLGEGAHAELAGIYLVRESAHADLTSRIVHRAADTTTNQIVRGVAHKGGRGVFQGLIEVGAGAVRVDARQHHDALLLEDGAEVFAKPELRIDCDDVQCAHGNTVGALDAEALFYLRQRGIDEASARALLIEAFLTQAVPDWLDETMREKVLGQIRSWLGAAP
jgi:Fe-S cluster assembly protein SufD